MRARLDLILTAVVLTAVQAAAQDIPRDNYLRFVPLEPMVIQPQTEPDSRLLLYGDSAAPDYVDLSPRNGIDDRRDEVFQALAVRFAPILVLNTDNLPVDHRWYARGRKPFYLFHDRWRLSGHEPVRASSDSILWRDVGADCPAPGGAGAGCRFLELLAEYNPEHPEPPAVAKYSRDPLYFDVLFFDFPGDGERTWKKTMRAALDDPAAESSLLLQYVHPFVTRRPDAGPDADAYRLALQYWLFYPYNDGGNNHEGDWEHVNVVVGPRSRLGHDLTGAEVESIVTGTWPKDDPIVLHEIEYYFHHNVMVMDFSAPDAYQDRAAWKAARDRIPEDRAGAHRLLGLIRALAFQDKAETRINTHPVVYVGADNKGTDQLLSSPGGKNRDSHGSYPLPGMYKDIGPAGATEQIGSVFDHKAWFAAGGPDKPLDARRGKAVSYARPERVRVVPDWERVLPLMETEGAARRDWGWLVLPLRWGYPAAASPFAGVVPHAETGNLAVPGPAYNGGWNRLGAASGFSLYEPHMIYSLFPLGWQDHFANNLGFLNLTVPTFLAAPPFDFVWSIASAPYRLWIKGEGPVFYPKEQIPRRFFGFTAGTGYQTVPNGFMDLFANEKQFNEYLARLLLHLVAYGDSTTQVAGVDEGVSNRDLATYQLVFFIGDRFSTENTLNHTRARFTQFAEFNNAPPFRLELDLNLWDYEGSFRYLFNDGKLTPYAKLGYGLSWYRLENARVNDQPMIDPRSPWTVRLNGNLGAGAEWNLLRSRSRGIPSGLDFSLRAEWQMLIHRLGLDEKGIALKTLVDLGFGPEDIPRNSTITRHQFVVRASLTW